MYFLKYLNLYEILFMQQVTVPILSNDKCKNMFLRAGRHEFFPEIFMCAGFDDGGRDACQVNNVKKLALIIIMILL